MSRLLPDELRAKLPPLNPRNPNGLDENAVIKFFLISGGWTWYASEFDGKDTFFGFVIGDFPEFGYFALSELESIGILIERDEYFKPKPLRQLRDHYKKEGYAL